MLTKWSCKWLQAKRFNRHKIRFGWEMEIAKDEILVNWSSNNLQNCKFWGTWIEILCSIYCKMLVVDRRHAYKSCGQKNLERI